MSKLIILSGPPYAGKTTLANALVSRFGHQEVDVDATKEALYGPGLDDEDLSRDQWNDIYARADAQIEEHLRKGRTVIDGSRNFRRRERIHARQIAERCEAQFVVVRVDTPVEVLRERMVENRANPARHDVSDQDFEALWHLWEPPAADEHPLILEYGADVHRWLHVHEATLG